VIKQLYLTQQDLEAVHHIFTLFMYICFFLVNQSGRMSFLYTDLLMKGMHRNLENVYKRISKFQLGTKTHGVQFIMQPGEFLSDVIHVAGYDF